MFGVLSFKEKQHSVDWIRFFIFFVHGLKNWQSPRMQFSEQISCYLCSVWVELHLTQINILKSETKSYQKHFGEMNCWKDLWSLLSKLNYESNGGVVNRGSSGINHVTELINELAFLTLLQKLDVKFYHSYSHLFLPEPSRTQSITLWAVSAWMCERSQRGQTWG